MHAHRWTIILIALVLVLLFAFQAAIAPIARAAQGPYNVATGLSVGYPVSLNDQQKLFFDTSSGLWWVFYSDGSSMQCTTSSDGINWAPPTAINSSVVSGGKFSVWFDDIADVLYYVATSGGPNLHYRYGTLTASGCGSISWSIGNTEVAGTYGNVNTPTISAIGPSTIWISVTENTKNNYYIEAFLCNSTGCSSKLLVTLPNATYESIILGMGSDQGTSSKAGLLYAADTASGGSAITFVYTTSGGSTWNSSAFTTVNTYQGNRMSACSIGTTVYVAANENNPNNILFFKYTLGEAESAEALLVKAGGGVRNVDITSDNNSSFVVGYTDSTNVGYIYSTDLGTTWGPVQILFPGEPTIYQSVLNIARGPDGLYGMMWSEGTTSHTIRFGTFSPIQNSTTTLTSTSISSATTGTTVTSNSTNQQITVCNGNIATCTAASFGAIHGAVVWACSSGTTCSNSSSTYLGKTTTDINGHAYFALPTTTSYVMTAGSVGFQQVTFTLATGSSTAQVNLPLNAPNSELLVYETGVPTGSVLLANQWCVGISPADNTGATSKCRSFDYAYMVITPGTVYTLTFSCTSCVLTPYPTTASVVISSGVVSQSPPAPSGHVGVDFSAQPVTTLTTSTTLASTSVSTATSLTSVTSTATTTTTQGAPSKSTSSLIYPLLILDILSSFVAFPISYYSFRFNRFVDSTTLRMVSIGFAILGTGLLVEGITTFIADATVVDGLLAKKLVADGGFLFFALQLVAYVSFAWAYGIEVFGKAKPKVGSLLEPGAVLPVGIIATTFGAYYEIALVVYLLMVALLAFIVFEAIMIYGRSKRRSALLVLLGFGLIFAGHVLMLDSVAALTPTTFYEGTIIQFVGFVSLLWFLIRSGRLGTA